MHYLDSGAENSIRFSGLSCRGERAAKANRTPHIQSAWRLNGGKMAPTKENSIKQRVPRCFVAQGRCRPGHDAKSNQHIGLGMLTPLPRQIPDSCIINQLDHLVCTRRRNFAPDNSTMTSLRCGYDNAAVTTSISSERIEAEVR
jgi:hypothetical protein